MGISLVPNLLVPLKFSSPLSTTACRNISPLVDPNDWQQAPSGFFPFFLLRHGKTLIGHPRLIREHLFHLTPSPQSEICHSSLWRTSLTSGLYTPISHLAKVRNFPKSAAMSSCHWLRYTLWFNQFRFSVCLATVAVSRHVN